MIPEIIVPIVAVAFICQYIDSSLGMGYGTSLVPLLMIAGYNPLEIVPALLLSQLVAGILAGIAHHRFGNVNFNFRESDHLKVSLILAGCGIVGAIIAVFVAVSIPIYILKLYIGLLILSIGILILLTMDKKYKFSWKKLTLLGFVAAFNKGISGGGYGPVATGGQIIAGIEGKNAIGITTLAEALTCIVAVLVYYFTSVSIDWSLTPSLLLGAIASVPISAFTVSKIPTHRMKIIVGIAVTILGMVTLIKILM